MKIPRGKIPAAIVMGKTAGGCILATGLPSFWAGVIGGTAGVFFGLWWKEPE